MGYVSKGMGAFFQYTTRVSDGDVLTPVDLNPFQPCFLYDLVILSGDLDFFSTYILVSI